MFLFNSSIESIDQSAFSYIPYSKKAVDDIIAKSVHTDKDGIIFTMKFASEDNPWGNTQMPTRNNFTYEQFNWKWDEIYKHNFNQAFKPIWNELTKEVEIRSIV